MEIRNISKYEMEIGMGHGGKCELWTTVYTYMECVPWVDMELTSVGQVNRAELGQNTQ